MSVKPKLFFVFCEIIKSKHSRSYVSLFIIKQNRKRRRPRQTNYAWIETRYPGGGTSGTEKIEETKKIEKESGRWQKTAGFHEKKE